MERIVYKDYFIDKTKTGFRVSKCDCLEKHSHLKNLKPCYKLIDNVINERIPRRCGFYYLESHARISNDEEYIRKVREYITVKQNKGKKQDYFNPSRKKSGGIF